MRECSTDTPWLIVRLKNQLFAVASTDVRELVQMPEVARPPDIADDVRGIINLRGDVMPVIDLRKRLGFTSAVDEIEGFCQLMRDREQDHKNWLVELEKSVIEDREFRLATDPHKCKFGQWYDSYEAESTWVSALVRMFGEPHRQIHAVALEVRALVTAGRRGEAMARINVARHGVLSVMLQLFSDLQERIRETQRELAMVVATPGRTFAATIDVAVSVEKMNAGSILELPPGAGVGDRGVVRRLGLVGNSETPTLIIETNGLVDVAAGGVAGGEVDL